MRHVLIASSPSGWSDEPLGAGVLDAVRNLPERFPSAGLVRLAVRRAEAWDRVADATGSTRVWLACESLQVTGSFKVRGALCGVDEIRRRGSSRVVAASAGNHGAGVAHAAGVLGVSATLVVPETTAEVKLQRMRREGVELVRVAGGYDDAERLAKQLADEAGAPFLSPYDDDWVLAGNGGSLGFELVEGLGRVPDLVVSPVGGGGLATGLAMAMEASGAAGRRVWTAQSEASPAFALSVVGGQVVAELALRGTTLAEGLEGGISARSAARVAARVRGVSVVSEAGIAAAMGRLERDTGLRVEGSGAVAAAVVLAGLPPFLAGGDVVVLLTGRNVDDSVLGLVVGRDGGC